MRTTISTCAGRLACSVLNTATFATLLLVTSGYAMAGGSGGGGEEDQNPIVVVPAAAPIPCVPPPIQAVYTSIQQAVNAAAVGATILVCPGNYAGQITINKSLSLQGVSTNVGEAVITAPSGGLVINTPNGPEFGGTAAQVLVQAPNVSISNLGVDGTIPTPVTFAIFGIVYDSGSSGTVRHVALRNYQSCVLSGGGFSCALSGGLLNLSHVNVLNSNIRGLGLFGTGIYGFQGSTVVKGNVIGCGSVASPYPYPGVGIVLAYSGPAQVSDNTISGCGVGLEADWYNSPVISISSNNLVNDGDGVFVSAAFASAANLTISGNNILSSVNSGIDAVNVNLGVIHYNTITGAKIGIALDQAVSVTVSDNTIIDAGVGVFGVNGNNVSNNTFGEVVTLTQ